MKRLNKVWSPETTVKTGKTAPKLFSVKNLFLVFVLLFMLSACSKDDNNEDNGNDNTETPAQGWKKLANFGGAKRAYAVCFSINGKIYAGLGRGNNATFQDFWEYNPSTDKWTQKASCPKGGTSGGFSIGDKGYMLSGVELWEYNSINNEWTQKTNCPGVYGYSFASDEKGYVGTLQPYNFWEYNPQNDIWTQKSSINTTVDTFEPRGIYVNNKGYVFGGLGNYSTRRPYIVWEYNVESDQWTAKSDLPVYITGFVAFAMNNKIYAGIGNLGGATNASYDGNSFSNILYELDLEKNEWKSKGEFPAEGRERAVIAVVGKKVYIGLGQTWYNSFVATTYYNDFWEYTP